VEEARAKLVEEVINQPVVEGQSNLGF